MFAWLKTRVRQGKLYWPWRTLLMALVALAWFGLAGAAAEAWIYDKQAVASGEWWRLISAHWIHSDVSHATWDISGLVLLGILFERLLGNHIFGLLAAGTLGVGLWLGWGGTWMDYYCGLSGILNALMSAGLVMLWRQHHHPLIIITAMLYGVKIVLELFSDNMLFTHLVWQGVPQAHLAGLISGLLYTYLIKIRIVKVGIHENSMLEPTLLGQSCHESRRESCP